MSFFFKNLFPGEEERVLYQKSFSEFIFPGYLGSYRPTQVWFYKEIKMELREIFNDKLKEVKEVSSKDEMLLTADFVKADERNLNGRLYPEKVLKKAIEGLQRKLRQEKAILATTGHKKEPEVPDVSHIIQSVWYNPDRKTGQVNLKVLPTTEGRNVQTIIKHGGSLGLSLRGIGSVTKVEGVDRINDDFELHGIDIVVNPSFTQSRFSQKNLIGESLDLQRYVDKKDGKVEMIEKDMKERWMNAKEAGYQDDYETYKKDVMKAKEEISEENKELRKRWLNDKRYADCKLTFEQWREKFGRK